MKKTGLMAILTGLIMVFCAPAVSGQSIRVLAPNGGERWDLGERVAINWEAIDYTENVRIILYRGGFEAADRVGVIADSIPAGLGTVNWEAGAVVGGTAPVGDGYYIRIRAISLGGIVDFSDAPFTLFSSAPNIRCRSMHAIGWDHTFLPATFTAGDTVTVKYYLDNDSAYPAGAFNVGLRVGGVIIARNAVASLVNGAALSGQFSWTATCGAPVEVVADCDNAITEINERDNIMTDPGLACSQPNLVLWNTSFSGGDPTHAKAGLRYQFYAQVRADTATARNVRIRGGVVGGAVLLDRTVTEMNPGDNESVDFIWEVPEGSSTVFFQVDPGDSIVESNETDNRWELPLTGVVSTPAEEHYDLSVRLTSPPSRTLSRELPTLKVGKAVTVAGEIRGATGAIRDVIVTATLSMKGSAPTRIHQQTISRISSLIVPFSFPWTPTQIGEQKITVKVDLGPHAVAVGAVDADPSNNRASVKVRVVGALITPFRPKR